MPAHRLLLIRHAKAATGSVDADRPLTHRGERQSAAIGAWLAKAGLTPDRVLVSPARRAAQTWELASAALERVPQPTVEERIYDNTVEDVLAAIRETPEEVQVLAVVGHNPSFGDLARALDDGRGDRAARRAVEDGLPTAAVAVFGLDGSFAELDTATLHDFTAPTGH